MVYGFEKVLVRNRQAVLTTVGRIQVEPFPLVAVSMVIVRTIDDCRVGFALIAV